MYKVYKVAKGYSYDLCDRYHKWGEVGSSYWGKTWYWGTYSDNNKFESDFIDVYDKIVSAFVVRGSYTYAPNKMDLFLKNRVSLSAKPSIKEPHFLEIKALPSYLH